MIVALAMTIVNRLRVLRWRVRAQGMAAIGLMAAIVLTGSLGAAESLQSGPGTLETQADWFRLAFREGGLTLALIAVLWSYRRDLRRMSQLEREQGQTAQVLVNMLVGVVQTATSANERSAAASEATEKAIHRLSDALDIRERRSAKLNGVHDQG